MAATDTGSLLTRVTGGMFVVAAVAFAAAATVLSSTFGWPDILREPAAVVLHATPRSPTVDEVNPVDGVGAVDALLGSTPTTTRSTAAGRRNGTP